MYILKVFRYFQVVWMLIFFWIVIDIIKLGCTTYTIKLHVSQNISKSNRFVFLLVHYTVSS